MEAYDVIFLYNSSELLEHNFNSEILSQPGELGPKKQEKEMRAWVKRVLMGTWRGIQDKIIVTIQ